jgi:hypothetical protein
VLDFIVCPTFTTKSVVQERAGIGSGMEIPHKKGEEEQQQN